MIRAEIVQNLDGSLVEIGAKSYEFDVRGHTVAVYDSRTVEIRGKASREFTSESTFQSDLREFFLSQGLTP